MNNNKSETDISSNPLSKEKRNDIIDSILTALKNNYIYPDVAEEMDSAIRRQAETGAYDSKSTLFDFLEALQGDLRNICHDRHLILMEYTAPDTNKKDDTKQIDYAAIDRSHNYGIEKAECLSGNIGYLKINEFLDPAVAGPTAVAAMNFLGNVDALIVDLRANGGGWGEMVRLISSYFFSESTHLHTIYIRPEDKTDQSWTHSYVAGPRLDKIPIYVLISRRTASAAEEFADNLKNLKRAVIVGETSKGAAHPIEMYDFPSLGISVQVPYARSISPITGENWEGRGIAPDIAVPAEKAFEVAYKKALDSLSKNSSDEMYQFREQWAIRELNSNRNPKPKVLKEYVGNYGSKKILLEDGVLYFIYDAEGTPRYPLISLGNDWFKSDLLSYYELQFIRDDSNKIIQLVTWRDSGSQRIYNKDR